VAPRRLTQLRECLHDPVKLHLGANYASHFGETPFAKHGGPKGTTARLSAWLATLSDLVNLGALSPGLVASVLVFFRGPPQECEGTEASAAAEPVVGEPSQGGLGSQPPDEMSTQPSKACPEATDDTTDPPAEELEATGTSAAAWTGSAESSTAEQAEAAAPDAAAAVVAATSVAEAPRQAESVESGLADLGADLADAGLAVNKGDLTDQVVKSEEAAP